MNKEIENIENIEENFEFIKYPDPPKVVYCHYGSYDSQGFIWWEYNEFCEDITWEVKRYRLDPISKKFLPKGTQIYHDIIPRKYELMELEVNHHYRFTVSAINKIGKGKESKFSTVIFTDLPLPNGWFRSPSQEEYSYFYYNLNIQSSSICRPENIPYYIDDERVVKEFIPEEVSKLTSLWNEEMAHFEKMTKQRLQIVLYELGYDFTSREVGIMIREYSRKSSECLFDYQAYMEVMYSLKLKAIENLLFTVKVAQAGRYIFCSCFSDSNAAKPASLIERVGEWEIRRSKNIDRVFAYHRAKDIKHWFLPHEVRLYISPDHEILDIGQKVFDPTEIDLIKHLYCHLDIYSVGGVNAIELYRYLYIASHPTFSPSNPFLSQISINERLAIFSTISLSTLPPPISSPNTPFSGIRFLDFFTFCVFMKRNENDEAKKFHTAFPSLSNLNINKKTLVSSTEAYLIARRDHKFETMVQKGLFAMNVTISPETVKSVQTDDKVRKFSVNETGGVGGDYSWAKEKTTQVTTHSECCFCGCKTGRLG